MASQPKAAAEWAAPPWFEATLRSMIELLELEPNWDSYGGSPVGQSVAVFVVDFLQQVMPDEASLPSVVPSPDGGISLEWHRLRTV